ncbi:MAG: transglycosylase SLT domain-containing protein [Proteobacteria bacterium]|nr:transglycosylase SLT domain-containing protein [Pseudomonadota bacterium]
MLATWFAVASASLAHAESLAGNDAARRTELRAEAIAYEHGEGVPRDGIKAAALYCEAARLGDAEAQYNLGWMYANGRGVERSDKLAAYFFHAAAEQGLDHAVDMLARVGDPPDLMPDCMREPRRPAGVPLSTRLAIRAPKPYVDLVRKIAPEYSVQPQLALSIMEAESRFNPQALSPKNAQGLMQLIPETSARFKVKNAYDPAQNIRGGIAYLGWLLAYFRGDVALVAAAYNAGEKTVDRYRGVPPYAETRAYVQRVLGNVGATEFPYDPKIADASPNLTLIREARGIR